jgi:hypothetical protein
MIEHGVVPQIQHRTIEHRLRAEDSRIVTVARGNDSRIVTVVTAARTAP